jgi:hypothetical protein
MKDISTQDLMKELLLRVGDHPDSPSCIKIEIGMIMNIAYYPETTLPFVIEAESHSTKKYNNIDDAIKEFFRLYKK